MLISIILVLPFKSSLLLNVTQWHTLAGPGWVFITHTVMALLPVKYYRIRCFLDHGISTISEQVIITCIFPLSLLVFLSITTTLSPITPKRLRIVSINHQFYMLVNINHLTSKWNECFTKWVSISFLLTSLLFFKTPLNSPATPHYLTNILSTFPYLISNPIRIIIDSHLHSRTSKFHPFYFLYQIYDLISYLVVLCFTLVHVAQVFLSTMSTRVFFSNSLLSITTSVFLSIFLIGQLISIPSVPPLMKQVLHSII